MSFRDAQKLYSRLPVMVIGAIDFVYGTIGIPITVFYLYAHKSTQWSIYQVIFSVVELVFLPVLMCWASFNLIQAGRQGVHPKMALYLAKSWVQSSIAFLGVHIVLCCLFELWTYLALSVTLRVIAGLIILFFIENLNDLLARLQLTLPLQCDNSNDDITEYLYHGSRDHDLL